MFRRHACVAILGLVAAVSACEKSSAVSTGGGTLLPSRAASTGEFPDNPLLAFVPADTPYAFATFKPFPIDVIRRMIAVIGPVWHRAFAAYMAQTPDSPEQRLIVKDILDTIDTFDVKRFEEYGFSAKSRGVAYGLGAYPVFRFELSSGDRVFDLVRRTTERWNLKLPPPTERAGRRYWIVDTQGVGLFAAIAPKEIVLAVAPRGLLDANLSALVGEQRPPRSMTTAQLRALADRDGFTGQGVGFVDLVRVGAMIADATGAAPDCRAAVAALARRAPRIAFGYDDVTLHRLAFGMVVELATDVLAEARGLSGSLAGLDRLLAQKPAMALAVAGNLEHGRTTLAHVTSALQDLGQRCQLASFVDGLKELGEFATRPLPPVVAGLRGGLFVLNNLKMGPRGDPEAIDGFGSVQLDHADDLVQLARSETPGFDVKTDGKAYALPSVIPFPGHVAANEHTIGFGLGANSASTAVAALQGKPGPAPLALLLFDYGRMGDLIMASEHGPDADIVREIIKMFGVATIQFLIDARGVVTWMSFELR